MSQNARTYKGRSEVKPTCPNSGSSLTGSRNGKCDPVTPTPVIIEVAGLKESTDNTNYVVGRMGNRGSKDDDDLMAEQAEPLAKSQSDTGLKPGPPENNNAKDEKERADRNSQSSRNDEEEHVEGGNDENVKSIMTGEDEEKGDDGTVNEITEEKDVKNAVSNKQDKKERTPQMKKTEEKEAVDDTDQIIKVKEAEQTDDGDVENTNGVNNGKEILLVPGNNKTNSKEINEKEDKNRIERVNSQGDDDVIVTVAGRDDVDAASTYSLFMEKDFRYYFQHPYCRLFFAYFVVFCNFLIYAEDPVAHSRKECLIPMVGNDFAFVGTRYPPNAWSLLKVLLWLVGIAIGMFVGKLLVHRQLFNRLLRLKMFSDDQGSWMIMFLITLICVFIMSLIYNGFLSIGGEATSQFRISDLMGVSNDIFMKVAACGTWCGDFFTAWMVTDIMLQEKLYPGWARPIRRWWKEGWHRIVLFWIIVIVTSFVVIFVIATDYIQWDKLNRDFLPTNELSRAFLASFILVMDLMIVMQDWDFPHFMSNIDIKLPGLNTAHIRFSIPKCLRKESWNVHITGKWFNYGILFMVMILDMNMWKNQIFYTPYDYGQYTGPEDRIYTVQDQYSLDTFNETLMSFDYRNSTINPNMNQTYTSTDTHMNSRYYSFHLGVKAIAFIPSLCMFITFGVLVWMFGRFKPTETDPYAGRLKKRIKKKKRFSFKISWKRREEIRRKIHAVPKLLYFRRKNSTKKDLEIEEKEIPSEGFSSENKEVKNGAGENVRNNKKPSEKSRGIFSKIPKVLLFWRKENETGENGIEQKEIFPQKSSENEVDIEDNKELVHVGDSEGQCEEQNKNIDKNDDS